MKIQKTTERFDRAVKKLYTAFHEGTLNAGNCKHCAVGNIIGHGNWWGGSGLRYIELGKPARKKIDLCDGDPNKSGYSLEELAKIEYLFIIGHAKNYSSYLYGLDKEDQFNGLCAVVEYLAELDGIPNPMDYTKLFEYNQKGAVYQL